MDPSVAVIIDGIFSEYGALVGVGILIIFYLLKVIDKRETKIAELEAKNDALEKEIRDTISGVVTQNTLTLARIENGIQQPRVAFPQPQLEYYPENQPERRTKPRKGSTE